MQKVIITASEDRINAELKPFDRIVSVTPAVQEKRYPDDRPVFCFVIEKPN